MKISKLTKAAFGLFFFAYTLLAHADFGQYVDANNIYHIKTAAKGGNDSNPCTASKPCLTLATACTKVTRSGSVIHVNVGTFVETSVCNKAIGVSIVGEGKTLSLIYSSYSANNLVQAVSTTEGTIDNSEIKDIGWNGNSTIGFGAIYVQGRSGVLVHDNNFADFLNNATTFNGRADNTYNFAPKVFATGNKFYNNTVSNSSLYSTNGTGSVQYGGQDGILIYGNNISTAGRGTSAVTGWPIKYYRGGYNKNDKIFNNILTKPDMDGTGGFGFVGELWHGLGGTEIYGNTITGGTFDMNCYEKGISAYSIDFHDNRAGFASMATVANQSILSLESSASDVLFRNNYVYNMAAAGSAVYVYSHTTQPRFNNIKIINNIVVDSRLTNFAAQGTGSTATFNNWLIANNTLYHKTVGTEGIRVPVYGKVSNIQVRNNIVSGFTTAPVIYDGAATAFLDGLSIENNLFFNNGNSNLLKTSGATNQPTNLTVQNQINTDPLFVVNGTDYRIQTTSPAKNKGIDVGVGTDFIGLRRTSLPDIGALEFDENVDSTNVAQP